MLLSSVAEAMFWSGRYVERAQALARAIQAVERLSLDLPGRHTLGLRPLLPLVSASKEANGSESGQEAQLRALVLNADDASSVLGALSRARENLRQARVVVPPELWAALNEQYQRLTTVADQPLPQVVDSLEAVLEGGTRIEGEALNNMARDAAYSFFHIGNLLERADMLLRVLSALLPALFTNGWERTFDDVRWAGLLQALGLRSMYRRRHHHQTDLALLLEFLLADMASPRSVVHCLRLIDEELGRLPRTRQVRSALAVATTRTFGLSHAAPDAVSVGIEATLAALAEIHEAMQTSYFPESVSAHRAPTAGTGLERGSLDPFAHLGHEHALVEQALSVLDALAKQAASGDDVDKSEIATVMAFLTDFGELGHHEKEEFLLTPLLVEHGFDWFEGPIAEMRREHRHEHSFIRVFNQLTALRAPWSSEDRRCFVSDAREFAHFLRTHMDRERRDVFEPAALSLPELVKEKLARAFVQFDVKQPVSLLAASTKLTELLHKYGS